MKLRTVALLGALACSTSALADSIDLNLHNDAMRLTYAAAVQSHKGLEADAGILYNKNNDGINDNVYHVGMAVHGQNWNPRGTFDISVGGRLMYTSIGSYNLSALGVGGSVRFSPIPRVGFGGEVYVAPNILSFLDAKAYSEGSIRVDYQLLPQAFVYVGYREVHVDVNNGPSDLKLDHHAHIGFKILF